MDELFRSFPIYQHPILILLLTLSLSFTTSSSILRTLSSPQSMFSAKTPSVNTFSSVAKLASRTRRTTPCFTRSVSTLPRPYRFHTGASWAGKPPDPTSRKVNTAPFTRESPIGRWRDHVLSRSNANGGRHIGEDFFYIQEVSMQLSREVSRSRVMLCRCGASRYAGPFLILYMACLCPVASASF